MALIVETSVVYGRQILDGIAGYINTHEPWSVFLDERELDAPPPDWLFDWSGDGVICRSTTLQLAESLRARGMPAVDLNDNSDGLGLPRIASDMPEIGRVAARHLLARGFTQIAYCGFEGEPWSDQRLEGVCEVVDPCGVLKTKWRGLREHAWEEERNVICGWLETLPKPLGIVACNDVRGHHVLDSCQTLGLAVPEQVAVIGVDNAETFCALCHPQLSSVVPNAYAIGHEAARLLAALIDGEKPQLVSSLMPPKGVVTRQSTDSVAIHDPLVASMLQFIRENSNRSIGVGDLLPLVTVSRSTLERRFKTALGRTPAEEIQAARLKRVKDLLAKTDWTLSKIAESTGYEHPEYMIVQFKREIGSSPSEWRMTRKLSDSIENLIVKD